MSKNIHSGIQNIKPVSDNQFIVRHATKGKGGWQWGRNSKPRGGSRGPKAEVSHPIPTLVPGLQNINELRRASQAEHMTHWAALTPALKFRISELVSELWMCPARLKPLREETDTLWVGGQRAGKVATGHWAGLWQPQHLPLQCVTVHRNYVIWFALTQSKTRQWLSP